MKGSGKAPRGFKKPIRPRRFEAFRRMLPDEREKSRFTEAFEIGDGPRYRLVLPEDAKAAKELLGILKNLRKARRGPRTIRILLVVLLVAGPIVFNLVFLDALATEWLRSVLEKRLDTDVDVDGLDIAPMAGRVSLRRLGIASRQDEMVDAWVLEDLAADVDTGALLRRRVVFDRLTAGLLRGVPRTTPADYPDDQAARSDGFGGSFPDLSRVDPMDWMPLPSMPEASIAAIQDLRLASEERYEELASESRELYEASRELAQRAETFLNTPWPDNDDLAGWTSRIEEGRSLIADIDRRSGDLENLGNRISRAAAESRRQVEDARRLVEEDVQRALAAVTPDAALVNTWIEAAIGAYLGENLAGAYQRILALRNRATVNSGDTEAATDRGKGRMKRGRIVSFPVSLPPRFSIRRLELAGPTIELRGSDVGVDHDLAGAPSRLTLEYSPESTAGIVRSELVIDGRSEAIRLLDGRVRVLDWSWRNGDAGGRMSFDAGIQAEDPELRVLQVSGTLTLGQWDIESDEGLWAVVDADSPNLEAGVDITVEAGRPAMRVVLPPEMLRVWAAELAEGLIPSDAEDIRENIMGIAGEDLSAIEDVANRWSDQQDLIDGADSRLEDLRRDIRERLEQRSAGGADKALEGLRSLF